MSGHAPLPGSGPAYRRRDLHQRHGETARRHCPRPPRLSRTTPAGAIRKHEAAALACRTPERLAGACAPPGIRLAELSAAGLPADADAVQAEIDTRYRTLAQSRAPPLRSTARSGRCCVASEHWRAVYESLAPGLAARQRDAIEAYAATRLR
ncbi:TipAS antibiotic-recognition domain-containing protein [Streptomyces sp. TLI_146]|uniref:TipAS antibiotic-recognition domain-containing protein n=1 Tax=Streptomyces sp. TLI_146 TaxID=1938858 RepID=UPI0035A6682A